MRAAEAPRAAGTIARSKPRRDASRRRRSSPETGRSSPSSPTSPTRRSAASIGRSRSDEASASATARSRPGSLTSGRPRGSRRRRGSAARSRPGGRAPPAGARAGSGRSRRPPRRRRVARRRDERLDLDEQRPAALEGRRDDAAGRRAVVVGEERAARIGNLAQAGLAHLEHAELIGGAEPVLRGPDEAHDAPRSPPRSMTASTRCSSVRGPAIEPSLVTWPTSTTAIPSPFASSIRRNADSRTWPTLPAGPSRSSDGHRLDRIDDDQRGPRRPRGLHDGARPRCRKHRDGVRRGAAAEAEPCAAEADLPAEFLARRVQDAPARPGCNAARDLEQQRGLADAGLAADQQERPGHDPATEDPVELPDAGRQPIAAVAVALACFVQFRARKGHVAK